MKRYNNIYPGSDRFENIDLKAVVFDLDGTLTMHHSPWRLVHERFGSWDKAVKYHDMFFSGAINYQEWCRLDAELMGQRSLEEINVVVDQIEPSSEALEVLRALTSYKLEDGGELKIMILSSGFESVAYRILNQAGISEGRVAVIANRLEEIEGKVMGVAKVAIGDPDKAKPAHIARFLEEGNISAESAIAFDDRLDDRELYAGFGAFVHVQKPHDLLLYKNFLGA